MIKQIAHQGVIINVYDYVDHALNIWHIRKCKATIIMIQAVISTFLREIFFDCRIDVVAIEINYLASTFIAF